MYEKELSVALEAARLAGEVILKYFNLEDFDVKLKTNKTIVTQADIESNKLILEKLKESFPEDGIISEELEEVKGDRKWYVDPLDGTESFVRGSDEFGIHIGLCENKLPVLGVVFRPVTGDIYYCAKGLGAFKENKDGKTALKILPNPIEDMTGVMGYGEKQPKKLEPYLKKLNINKKIIAAATGLKILKLTDNKADIFILSSPKTRSWDICAPHAILLEAGGNASYSDGNPVMYIPEVNHEKVFIFTGSKDQLSHSIIKLKEE